MRYRTALLSFLLVAGGTAAQAQLNLGLLAGIRDESGPQGPEGTIGAVGFTADFGRPNWVVRPEIGIFSDIDFFAENETEISLGIVHSWTPRRVRLSLGAGLDFASTGFDFRADSTVGYAHGSAEWVREKGAALGLDLRFVDDTEIEVDGHRFHAGYLQIACRMTWTL